MSFSKISHRYAQAFFEEASDKGILVKVLEGLRLISNTLVNNSNLSNIFNNPSMTSDQKFEIFQGIFYSYVDKQVLIFVKFLATKKRIYLLQEIAKEIENIHHLAQGIFPLKVVVSPGLGEDFCKKLLNKLTKVTEYNFDPEIIVDESLQGGFVYSYQGQLFDYSIKGDLRALTKTLNTAS